MPANKRRASGRPSILMALVAAAMATGAATEGLAQQLPWSSGTPEEAGIDPDALEAFQESLAERGTQAFLILRDGRMVHEWYAPDRSPEDGHFSASLAKALTGGYSLAVALEDGAISLEDTVGEYVPRWDEADPRAAIRVRHLAQHASGLEDAADEDLDVGQNELPGWKGEFWRGRSGAEPDPITVAMEESPLIFEPGTSYAYSNPGFAVLGYAVTAATEQDLRSSLQQRVMDPIGLPEDEWSVGYGRTFEVDGLPVVANWGGGGFTPRAVARLGLLALNKGSWDGRQVLSEQAVNAMLNEHVSEEIWDDLEPAQPAPALGWYVNVNRAWPEAPPDTVVGAGAQHQLLIVVPSMDMIVVRNGASLDDDAAFWEAVHTQLVQPLMHTMETPRGLPGASAAAPYPPSDVIAGLEWAPADEVIRMADGSDTWPATWADDGHLYTAYADGWGFEPQVEEKLSLGVARVEGDPPHVEGVNIRSEIEEDGDGRSGRKASGMLMVHGVLYMWLRNADRNGAECQLVWSEDHGETWQEVDWRLERFGYATFLNFGRNYAGARDEYVYVYSHDHPSAYEVADSFVLMRVPKERVREREAYEFFAGLEDGEPTWSGDSADRSAVFEHAGASTRSGISYNAALGRYFWWQQIPAGGIDTRFEGGFGVYDAPEPWGPWTTVYYTPAWDIGPGETASFPTKWMSDDGREVHLLFSGDDHFSVRYGRLLLTGDNDE